MITNVMLGIAVTEGAIGLVLAYKSLKTIKETQVDVDKHNATIERLEVKIDKTDRSLKNEIKDQINKQFYRIAFTRFL